ncbi:FecR domain-containing protein [Chitinophaga sp. Cy-1792]|uniref:FecR domain-containing protein n=1 Tax=Chitinophaga sp. Cy-1792 TaxID=2608339 RepID=UPI00141FA87B|nr:FecR domain-containing protein [Chitinophaga sp. Cy-1792]NIG53839.1 DUF4974 domain-containing protein [Chitinophaga sp. Cy-1792]
MNRNEAQSLLQKYLENRCTPEEQAAVEQWYNTLLTDYDWKLEGEELVDAQQNLKQKIDREIGWQQPVVPLYRRAWLRYAAAILLLAGISTWLFFPKQHTGSHPGTLAPIADIQPGTNKATLTLANGKTLLLSQQRNDSVAMQGNTRISQRSGGLLVYNAGSNMQATAEYNTLTTPKGGQYQLMLPDGSRVWLNAMSTVRFPTRFSGKERRIIITGEAFFDIAPDKNQPFIVSANNTDITVLGTIFNVSAYPDDNTLKTTLLQGKVSVSSSNTVILSPGQQAVSNPANGKQTIKIIANADTEQATAWMNGYFQFKQASVKEVMQQVSRWYDVEISYEGPLPDKKFSGEISRSSKLSEVLAGLAISGINTKTQGNKVIIIP